MRTLDKSRKSSNQENPDSDSCTPKLRFKGFEGEWKIFTLEKVSETFKSGESITSKDIFENGEYPVFGGNGLRGYANSYTHDGSYLLIGRQGALCGNVKRVNGKAFISEHAIAVRTNDFADTEWLAQKLDYMKLNRLSESSAQPGLAVGRLLKIKLPFPSLPEQQKIAAFLSAVDEKIQQLTRKKEALERYKKGVMQQLFSGKLRFKDENGKAFPKWEEKRLGDVLFEHKLKSTGKEEVYSVSVHKGLVNQVEHLGRVFAAKDTANYNLVKPHDVIYTKSPTGDFPLGIIKQSKVNKNVIVSPLYGIFEPETPGLGYMLNVYFETPVNVTNYLSSIIQKGAKNTINITNTTFLSKKMKLPISKEEQNIIGAYLSSIDNKIESVSALISQTQLYKKSLLQQLFV
jgi:type I restriction enzyme S subunit